MRICDYANDIVPNDIVCLFVVEYTNIQIIRNVKEVSQHDLNKFWGNECKSWEEDNGQYLEMRTASSLWKMTTRPPLSPVANKLPSGLNSTHEMISAAINSITD